MKRQTGTAFLFAILLIAGCATTPPDVIGVGTQLETRQAQTREFDTLDKAMTMRSVVATLQDLGFTIDQADAELGTITATRLDAYTMRMTVTVVRRTGDRIAVRAFARVGENAVTDAPTYQDFFVALDKAMFLTQNQVD